MREDFVLQVRRYLDGELTFDELDDWTGQRFRSLSALGPSDPVGKLWAAELACLHELSAGRVDERWCRGHLAEALAAVAIQVVHAHGPALAAGSETSLTTPIVPVEFTVGPARLKGSAQAYTRLAAAPS